MILKQRLHQIGKPVQQNVQENINESIDNDQKLKSVDESIDNNQN